MLQVCIFPISTMHCYQWRPCFQGQRSSPEFGAEREILLSISILLYLQSYEVLSLLEGEKESDHRNHSVLNTSWNGIFLYRQLHSSYHIIMWSCALWATQRICFGLLLWLQVRESCVRREMRSEPDPTLTLYVSAPLNCGMHVWHCFWAGVIPAQMPCVALHQRKQKGIWCTFLWKKQDSSFSVFYL